ncbi:hypothetical protein KIN20_033334 [Parelaphostrongylus tenuis]|uniref:Uncharacterized protein n=1 Tax=Parelaphostrongylus tenuis TaxID=148309 RepID=A0AAD5R8C7_PARTN|nr:hypothetical protein KIN20_033334 [Parelaphostrongylus tenuis]
MKPSALLPTKEYLSSMDIPCSEIHLDEEDQLRVHLLCAMLSSPQQIDNEGIIIADAISGGKLNFYTMGMIATKEDMVEVEKIANNPELLFLHPWFRDMVNMDENNMKLRPVPPDVSKTSIRKDSSCRSIRQDMRRTKRIR